MQPCVMFLAMVSIVEFGHEPAEHTPVNHVEVNAGIPCSGERANVRKAPALTHAESGEVSTADSAVLQADDTESATLRFRRKASVR